jgi:copper transport outer membrane protein MctB
VIDFRYHLVSIVAVFLALAIGIVVGAEALTPKVANTLNNESKHALKQNDQLNAQIAQLKQGIAADNALAQAVAPTVLANLLAGEKVVLITAPGASNSVVTGITAAIKQAAGQLTGTVSLTPQFFDTDVTTETTLTQTAGQLAPPGVISSESGGGQIAGQQAAAKVIAAAIMDCCGTPTLTNGQLKSILTGFGDQGFLQVSNAAGGSSLTGQATLAVVVIPGATAANASSLSPENLALVYLTRDLMQAGEGALLAGSVQGSGNGSAIDAVTSGGAGFSLTTVDNADTETGQIIVVQALRNELNPNSTPTSYGVGPGVVPSPAPTSAPTPSTSPNPAKKRRKR